MLEHAPDNLDSMTAILVTIVRFTLPLVAIAGIIAIPHVSQAETRGNRFISSPQFDQRNAMREHWKNMSPQERAEIRTKMQQRWSSMPPDVRKEKRDAMREHWKNMSPQERDQFRRVLDSQSGK